MERWGDDGAQQQWRSNRSAPQDGVFPSKVLLIPVEFSEENPVMNEERWPTLEHK